MYRTQDNGGLAVSCVSEAETGGLFDIRWRETTSGGRAFIATAGADGAARVFSLTEGIESSFSGLEFIMG